eukprot:3797360-Rhodomonas_salina.2
MEDGRLARTFIQCTLDRGNAACAPLDARGPSCWCHIRARARRGGGRVHFSLYVLPFLHRGRCPTRQVIGTEATFHLDRNLAVPASFTGPVIVQSLDE